MRSEDCTLRAACLSSLQARLYSTRHLSATTIRRRRTQDNSSRHIEQFAPCLLAVASAFSSLRTLFSAPKLQPSPFHAFRDSWTHRKNITIAFPVTSALFVRSFARERKSTPLLSWACALFCGYVGVARTRNMLRSAPLSGRIARNPSSGCRLYLQPTQ